MKRSILLLVVGAVALSSPYGCKALKKAKKAYDKKKNKDNNDQGGGGGGESGLSPEEQKDRALSRKLKAYIDISNSLTSRVYDSRRRYTRNLKDPKKGPTCKERYLYAPYTLSSVARLTKAVDKVQSAEPRLKDLEAGAAKYIAAVRTLEPLLKKAKRYYDQKDWKEDKCKGAQEMHPKLMAAWANFEAGAGMMDKAIKKYNLALHYRLLGRVAKRFGKNSYRYYHKKIPLDARELLEELRFQSREKKPDVEKVAAMVKKFDALVVEMNDKAKGRKKPSSWSWFKSGANDYVGACKEMMRRLKSGKKFSRSEKRQLRGSTAHWVKGSYAKCLKKFNELIDKTNRVRF